MSSYSTLLGAYRMSSSSQVLPPPSTSSTTPCSARASAAEINYRVVEDRPSVAAAALHSTGNHRYGTSTVSSRPRSSSSAVTKTSSSSSSYSANFYSSPSSAAARQPLVQAADLSDTQHRFYNSSLSAPTTQPQTYLSTAPPVSSSSSSSSSSHHYYHHQQQQKSSSHHQQQPQQQQQQHSSSSSSSQQQVLTQAQRSGGTSSSSSKNANVLNNANHHRLRSSMYRPKWDPALPRTRYSHRPLIILDLDETLVHATTTRPHHHSSSSSHAAHQCDLHFNVDMGPNQAPVPVWVSLRPGAKQFVYDIAAYFEVAVFTASIKNYADKVCECLDPSGTLIQHRLYRDHCSDVDGVFVKDLALLNRPLGRVAIIDNSPHAYLFHPENSVPILSWFDDTRDNELQKMLPMLIHRLSRADDVYDVLEQYRSTL